MTGRRWNSTIALLTALSVHGCANMTIDRYPTYPSVPRVAVLSETVSTWSETPAQDYVVPDSQLFVGVRTSGAMMALTFIPLFGALGAIAGAQLDRSRSAALLEGQESTFAIKFDSILRDELSRVAVDQRNARVRIAEKVEGAEIQALPHVRLTVAGNDDRLRASVHLTTRFFRAEDGAQISRRYVYFTPEERPMLGPEGWGNAGAAAVVGTARPALSRLAEVFVKDLAGQFVRASEADPPPIIEWRMKTEASARFVSGILLSEEPGYVVVIPRAGSTFMRGSIALLDRAAFDFRRPN